MNKNSNGKDLRPTSIELAKALEDFVYNEIDVVTESDWFEEKVDLKVKEILDKKLNRFTQNYYSDPYVTHPEITIKEPIPYQWVSSSYKNDVCPSFTSPNGLQIFVLDEETKKREQFEYLYSVILAEEYGEGNDLFNSNDWNKVLEFVNNYGEKNENK